MVNKKIMVMSMVNSPGPLPDLVTHSAEMARGLGSETCSLQNGHISPGGVYARLVTISALRSQCR